MKQFYVIGNPIAHSKSPIIHRHFAEQTGIELEYQQHLVELDDFENEINRLQSANCFGANITLPFKERAYACCKDVSARAKLSKAVNTLFFTDNGIIGDNTDGAGLVADLLFHMVDIEGKRILIVGAGGAARGVIPALLEQNPTAITVANRTIEKAYAIVSECEDPKLSASALTVEGSDFDIVINATSSSVNGSLPGLSLSALENATCVYDMFYSNQQTSFLNWAADHTKSPNAKLIDGLGMLIEQAAESFYLWHRVRPDTKALRDILRNK